MTVIAVSGASAGWQAARASTVMETKTIFLLIMASVSSGKGMRDSEVGGDRDHQTPVPIKNGSISFPVILFTSKSGGKCRWNFSLTAQIETGSRFL